MGSVTGLIHAYSQPFHGLSIATCMVGGRNWPRPGYLLDPVPDVLVEQLLANAATRDLGVMLQGGGCPDGDVCSVAQSIRFRHPNLAGLINSIGMTVPMILARWDATRDEAANRGTFMHWTFEAYLNRALFESPGPEFQMFRKFTNELEGLTAFRTEWTIFADAECLAGSIDFVAQRTDGSFVIFDWKRSANLRSKYSNHFQRMQYPLEHLDDCSGIHYRIQLNIYTWILETYYDASVSGMFVVCTHPDNEGTAFVDSVPRMTEEFRYALTHTFVEHI